MREIKFRAWDIRTGIIHDVIIFHNKYKSNGYVLRKTEEHPYSNSRGYVPEHRLVIEQQLKRFLIPRQELVHHVDGDRSNNVPSNLRLTNPKDHAKGHIGERNPNGQFTCLSPEFKQKKFRLYDKDRNIIQIYDLNELISKTFRRGKFEYRGEWTGLKDKNGKEIYEGDIVRHYRECVAPMDYETGEPQWEERVYDRIGYITLNPCSGIRLIGKTKVTDYETGEFIAEHKRSWKLTCWSEYSEIIGNIHENPELLAI